MVLVVFASMLASGRFLFFRHNPSTKLHFLDFQRNNVAFNAGLALAICFFIGLCSNVGNTLDKSVFYQSALIMFFVTCSLVRLWFN